MAEEKDAFYVVRKGDVVGIYKSFSDIRPSLASFDPYSSGGRAFNVSSSSRNLHGAIQFDTRLSCNLHFDGASKGNPGPAGAGAILRDGSKVYWLREGVGIQTNNVAEYRSLILGLKHALKERI
uniref:RNase H type-1 domain-containing protein n=1 Tax=Glycine max TaxID=3847 RepID=A0A0R0EQF3_SOYBN